MKIRYNAPVILTFSFLCLIIILLDQWMGKVLIKSYFTLCSSFDPGSLRSYWTLFSYVLGHGNTAHLLGNLYIILLIGPIMEEKYSSRLLIYMMIVTTLVTAVLNILLFNSCILGASGIVFMLIILSSFTNFRSGEIPLTFIVIAILYIGNEILRSFTPDNVSQFGHIIGGICGGFFGLKFGHRRK